MHKSRLAVMEASGGHRFCVVQPQRNSFGEDANRWNQGGLASPAVAGKYFFRTRGISKV